LVELDDEIVAYIGPCELLSGPFAAILNSRQSKTPAGSDAWVRRTLEAVEWARRHGYGIVTSMGMVTWELVLHVASQRGLPVVVFIPRATASAHEEAARVICDFGLSSTRTGFVFPRHRAHGSAKQLWPSRDEFVIRSAQILAPVSIRPDGNLARLTSTRPETEVLADFRVPYAPTSHHSKHAAEAWTPSQRISASEWPYLVHFTGTCHGPWPGEKSFSFYADLIESGCEYPRNAMATLRRILSMRKLIGSSDHLRGDTRAVAFTEAPPCDALALMRWRKRFVRWSFEPYGIGIDKAWAEVHGLHPVRYGTSDSYAALSEADRRYFQNQGAHDVWLPEREWRWLGDLDLCEVPQEMLCVLVRTTQEAAEIGTLFSLKTFAICQ
jgi:hypothetical protein